MITQERLKDILHYCPDTGVFTWLITAGNGVKSGDIAGGKCPKGYILIGINERKCGAHRLAFLYMDGSLPAEDTDHINGIRHDNRWINLRSVNRAENSKNTKTYSSNTSGVMGVSWSNRHKKWRGYLNMNKKQGHLYFGADFFEAVCIRKSAENKHGYHENHGRIV